MSLERFTYSVSAHATPFSMIRGGFAHFTHLAETATERTCHSAGQHITWTLRDHHTQETFKARQDVSTEHAVLYSAIVSERPLIAERVYETLSISTPKALSERIKSPCDAALASNNRLGVAQGTHIMTARGEMLVERLTVGDRAITRDHGMQTVRCIGVEQVTVRNENAPILIKKGAIKNARDLIVSPDHRVVIKGAKALMLYGVKEVLIPAQKLVNDDTVVRAVGGEVTYYQIVTDQHEVIYCEAAAAESFMPDANGLQALSQTNLEAMINAVPTLAVAPNTYGPAARRFVDL